MLRKDGHSLPVDVKLKRNRLIRETVIVYILLNLVLAASNGWVGRYSLSLLYWIFPLFPIYIFLHHGNSLKELGLTKEKPLQQVKAAIPVLAMMMVFVTLLVFIIFLFGITFAELIGKRENEINTSLSFLLPNIVLVGLYEELLFRGYFLSRVQEIVTSKNCAVILSSISFGIAHFWSSGSVLQVIFSTLFGCILAFARTKIENCTVLSVTLVHVIFNFTLLSVRSILT